MPPVATDADGVFLATLNAAKTELAYVINVRNAEGVVMAHVHCGPEVEDSPAVAFIHGQGMVPGEELFFPPA